ncbi:uncharacterized protein PRCAT00002436001 [Priceomyces carsonii]|uniref:uncharacterized protein n=1 Tax=Priceomyces carsonii TaxID=28549 RepID=UPI002ED85707|nr:unnamed protein product [Priceomyces carsonii]
MTNIESTKRRKIPRVLVACIRCQKKKRRCDGNQPCQTCTNFSSECIYDRPNYSVPSMLSKDSQNLSTNTQSVSINEESSQQKKALQQLVNTNQELRGEIDLLLRIIEEKNEVIDKLENDVNIENENRNKSDTALSEATFTKTFTKLLYLTSHESEEYIGAFAVISIVNAIKRIILGDDKHEEFSPVILENVLDKEEFVPAHIEEGFINKFFSLSHNRGYIIDGIWFAKVKQKQTNERNSWERFCFNMVLGIGCRLTELLNVTTFPSPEIYFRRALNDLSNSELDSVMQIQACMIIAIFVNRSYHISFYISSWELTGLAMRKLVQYGFHRKQPVTQQNAWNYEFRKRLFWSCYNYEKLMSLSLGRPCSVADSFIDIPFPLSIEFPTNPTPNDHYKLYQLQLKQESNPEFEEEISCFTSFINTSKVRRIESRIHLLFYSVSNCFPVADTFENIVNDIDSWYKALPSRKEFDDIMKGRESYDYFELLCHRARLILFLPNIMRNTHRERDVILNEACLSAGKICSSYKSLYKDSILEFSIVALHTVFLAGITMVYYLRNKGDPPFMNIQHNVRSCSNLLFVFSERWSEARTYSDLFDNILKHYESHNHSSEKFTKEILPMLAAPNTSLSSPQWSAHALLCDNEASVKKFNLDEDFWDKILHDLDSTSFLKKN